MANYGKFLSGRERSFGIGITNYSEDSRVLDVIGNVAIGGSIGIGSDHGTDKNNDTPYADIDTGNIRLRRELFDASGTMGADNTILVSLGGTSVTWKTLEGIADIGITVREEGVIAGLANSVRDVNFVGALVEASVSGAAATITVQAVDPGGTDGQVQYNDGGNFGGSADLTYNDVTGRVGIASLTPQYKLDVGGNIGVGGSGFFRRAYATIDTLTPQIDQELATKSYVDNFATAGLVVQKAVSVASTEPISAFYDNVDTSPDGVGAKLFGTVNGNINELNTSVPGIANTGLLDRFQGLLVSDRVLIKDQGLNGIGNTFENGYYTVTRLGSGSTSFELTRSVDFDQSAEITSGAFSFVLEGNENAGGGFVLITKEPVSIGVSALEFTQFSSPGELQAGKGLLKVGNRFDVVSLDSTAIVVNDDDINLAQVSHSFDVNTLDSERREEFFSEIEIDEYGRVTGIITSTRVAYGTSATTAGVARYNGSHFEMDFGSIDGTVGLASNTTGAVMAVDGTSNQITVTRDEGRVILGFPNDITINGQITANNFSGDGSSLSDVISGVGIQTGGNVNQNLIGVGVTILDFVGPVVGVVTGTRGTLTIESGADINTIGSANQVLFKNASNDATTSPNLTFNGTNLVCAGTVTANSDERLKENVETIPDALDKVKQLRGVEFDHKNTGDHCLGVIAQEVEKIVPDVVYEDALGVKSVAYMNMVALLIEAVKDQQKQIDELKSLLNN